MNEEQPRDVGELRDAEIRRERSLFPFLPDDADTRAGRLDHRDVIAAVAWNKSKCPIGLIKVSDWP